MKFIPFGTYLLTILCMLVYFVGGHPTLNIAESNPLALISYQFGHANLAHLMGNCLFLMLLGPFCEKRLGFKRFIGLYLVSGIGAALIFGIVFSQAHLIGASGSISGLMAVYPLLQSNFISKLLNGLFLGFIFYSNIISWMFVALLGIPADVAFLAHLGGGLTGLVLFGFMAPKLFKTNCSTA